PRDAARYCGTDSDVRGSEVRRFHFRLGGGHPLAHDPPELPLEERRRQPEEPWVTQLECVRLRPVGATVSSHVSPRTAAAGNQARLDIHECCACLVASPKQAVLD